MKTYFLVLINTPIDIDPLFEYGAEGTISITLKGHALDGDIYTDRKKALEACAIAQSVDSNVVIKAVTIEDDV